MKFSDFKDNPQDLVGKDVLIRYGRNSEKLSKITRVTKVAFAVDGESGLFRIDNGNLRGQSDRWNLIYCTMLTTEEADGQRKKFRRLRLIKEIPELIKQADLEALEKIKTILEEGK